MLNLLNNLDQNYKPEQWASNPRYIAVVYDFERLDKMKQGEGML